MKNNCQDIHIPSVNNDNETCNSYVPCKCVVVDSLSGELKTYFGLPDIPNLCQLSTNYGLSLIDARTRIAALEAISGGGGGIGVQVNSDWNSTSGVSEILNKPTLATVATSGDYDDLSNRPVLSPAATSGDYNDLDNKPSFSAVAVSNDYDDLDNKPSLSTVSTTGNYSDLLGKPSFGAVAVSNDYNDLDNKPSFSAVAISNDYDDLDNKPSFSAVAISNDYDDLDNKPSLSAAATSGDYDDLLNKPTLSTVAGTGNYTDLSNKPTLGTMAAQTASDYTPTSLLADVAVSNDYNDLDNKPSFSAVAISNDYDDLDNKPSLSAAATSGDYDDLLNKPSLSDVALSNDYDDLDNKPTLSTVATSNDYNDLDNKPSLDTMATESTDDYYTKTQVNDTLSNYPLYSEGTFTAVFNGDTSGTVSAVNQQYSRIGNQYTIYIDAEVDLSSFVGSIGITGFPNSATTNIISVSAVYHDPNITYDANSQQVIAKKSSTDTIKLYFVDNTSGSPEHNVNGSDFTGVGTLQFTMTYLDIDK